MPEATALFVACGVALILGGPVIRRLRNWGWGQHVRDDGPQSHLGKAGTPTMGGIIILAGLIAGVIVTAWRIPGAFPRGAGGQVLLVLGLAVGFGIVGFVDDYAIIKHRRSLGLRAREKLALQFILAGLFLYGLRFAQPEITIAPAHGGIAPGWWFYPLAALFLVFTSNSVNLADGLDGLAAGLAAITGIAVGIVAMLLTNLGQAAICFALAGGCLGFLWFNAHPARVFMGDTGALALGAALGGVAVVLHAESFLVVAGVIFYIEALSVIVQVASFRLTGKRVFRMSPLHHHLELSGWPEPQVVIRLWIISGLVAWIALLGMERFL